MAYDLFYKKQIPFDCSMKPGDAPEMSSATKIVLGVGTAALVCGIAKELERQGEGAQLRKTFSPEMKKTQEMPSMPMKELVFGEGYEEEIK